MFLTRARACVCVVHWHCTAQLSMFNMEKRFRNKIIIIIIIIIKGHRIERKEELQRLSLSEVLSQVRLVCC